jgi:hypothetical protein
MIAALRPDSWNLPLLVHVLGAMVFVALLMVLAVVLVVSLRDGGDRVAALRFAFRTLLLGLLPAYIVMRVGAEWVFSEENADEDAAWIGIGYIVTDLGLLLLIATAVLLGLARRRAASGTKEPRGLVRPATAITFLLIAAYAVALWAMTAKPA